MNKYYYDLHIHSCLSPCGDDDSTPNNIAGMATWCGLNVLALTDHNTTRNCPGFFEAAKRHGIIPIAGMELTTAEDIHVVCLFKTLSDAMDFNDEVQKHRILIKNRPDIFGEQLILDEEDNVVGREDNLLSNATALSLDDVPDLVKSFRGVCYPAHIDRNANSVTAILGTFPETPHFNCFELRDAANLEEYVTKYNLDGRLAIISSDSHYLTDMRDADCFFELDTEDDSEEAIIDSLFELLK